MRERHVILCNNEQRAVGGVVKKAPPVAQRGLGGAETLPMVLDRRHRQTAARWRASRPAGIRGCRHSHTRRLAIGFLSRGVTSRIGSRPLNRSDIWPSSSSFGTRSNAARSQAGMFNPEPLESTLLLAQEFREPRFDRDAPGVVLVALEAYRVVVQLQPSRPSWRVYAQQLSPTGRQFV